MAGLQWSGKENGCLPDDRGEKAVKSAEEPDTLRKTREDFVFFSYISVKWDFNQSMLCCNMVTFDMTSCMSLLGW